MGFFLSLPHQQSLACLRDEKAPGRRLVLATASDYHLACSVVEPLSLFDIVLGSDGQRNLKGRDKLKPVGEVCGEKFDYVGNSSWGLAIWQGCRYAVLVNAPRGVERAARRVATVVRVVQPSPTGFR